MERSSSQLYVDGWDGIGLGWLSLVTGSLRAPSVLIKTTCASWPERPKRAWKDQKSGTKASLLEIINQIRLTCGPYSLLNYPRPCHDLHLHGHHNLHHDHLANPVHHHAPSLPLSPPTPAASHRTAALPFLLHPSQSCSRHKQLREYTDECVYLLAFHGDIPLQSLVDQPTRNNVQCNVVDYLCIK